MFCHTPSCSSVRFHCQSLLCNRFSQKDLGVSFFEGALFWMAFKGSQKENHHCVAPKDEPPMFFVAPIDAWNQPVATPKIGFEWPLLEGLVQHGRGFLVVLLVLVHQPDVPKILFENPRSFWLALGMCSSESNANKVDIVDVGMLTRKTHTHPKQTESLKTAMGDSYAQSW